MRMFAVLLILAYAAGLAFLTDHLSKGKKIVLFALLAIGWYYIFYPALNPSSLEMWIMVVVLFVVAGNMFFYEERTINTTQKNKKGQIEINITHQPRSWVWKTVGVIIAVQLLSALICSPLFMAKSYAGRIVPDSVDFNEIPSYSFEETAVIDRTSAQLLGDKVMGQMTDLVSQFTASEEYSQISYQGASVRVTPLAYDGFIKYMRNRASGIPAYITVSTTSGKTSLKRLDARMRYVPSAYGNENLYRKLRFQFPFALFGSPTFEIDEEGNPWYVCTTYGYTGIHSKQRVTGVILFDPVSGTGTKYSMEEVPEWVDRVYPADLVIEELNNWGSFQKGFFNSVFGQEGVIETSEGYNYLAKDGDVWLYTGMTSAASDDSNVGFVLVNLRTHEAQYTATPGASESAVMASAEGEVLNYGYTATFPTLLNVAGKPVYLLSLKDSAGLIKMYAMVDAQDYQQVYTVKADKDSGSAIAQLIRQVSNGTVSAGSDEQFNINQINAVKTAVIDGNTYVYLKSGDKVFVIPVTQENAGTVLFLSEDSQVECMASLQEDGTYLVTSIEKAK